MKIIDAFADMGRFVAIRRDIHAHPELGFEEHRTARLVAELLAEWGVEVHAGVAAAHGCSAEVLFRRASPPLVNHAAEARFAAGVMREIVGAAMVDEDFPAVMGAEDFAHMLVAKPGCYAFLGNGDGAHREAGHGAGPCIVHSTSFDFNDDIIPIGASYFVQLAEAWLSRPA